MCKAIRILHRISQALRNKEVGLAVSLTVALLLLSIPMAEALPQQSGEPFISPIGYVTDLARLVEPEVERKICDLSAELERKTGVRVAVVTVPDLSGYEIEDFTNELLNRWMPDPAKRAKSVVIIDAPLDEKLRLEMGVGIDTLLSAEAAKRIREQVLLPALRKGDKGQAYLLTLTELAAEIARSTDVTLYQLKGPGFLKNQPASVTIPPPKRRDTSGSLWFLPVIMAALWIGYRETRASAQAAKNKANPPAE